MPLRRWNSGKWKSHARKYVIRAVQRNVELWIFPIARCAERLAWRCALRFIPTCVPMLSVTSFPARACLFYGIYDYPVIDYYFETIRRVGTSRLRAFVLKGEIFPFVEDEYREPRAGYYIFYMLWNIQDKPKITTHFNAYIKIVILFLTNS